MNNMMIGVSNKTTFGCKRNLTKNIQNKVCSSSNPEMYKLDHSRFSGPIEAVADCLINKFCISSPKSATITKTFQKFLKNKYQAK